MEKRTAEIVFEDDEIMAILAEHPASNGHIQVFTKKHNTVFEQLTDEEIGKVSHAANRLSVALFDTLNIGGTNLIIQNGTAAHQEIPHFAVNIIPRTDADGLNFEWQPKQADPDKLSSIEQILKSECMKQGEQPAESKAVQKDALSEDDYLVRQLDRVP